jgi:hypothetical protein
LCRAGNGFDIDCGSLELNPGCVHSNGASSVENGTMRGRGMINGENWGKWVSCPSFSAMGWHG